MFVAVYTNPICKSEEKKAVEMLGKIFEYYCKKPEELPKLYLDICEEEGEERAVCDYIAGMSDTYVVKVFNQLYVPKFWIE